MIIFFSDYFIRAHFRPLMSLRSRCSCEVEKCSMILVKISKSLRHLCNICLSAETIENTNEIYPVTFDGLGRRGGWEEEGSPGQRQFPVFEHTKISESAQRKRIYSKPLSRVI